MRPVWFSFLNGPGIEQLDKILIADRGRAPTLFRHRGLSLSDIVLAAAVLRKAEEHGLGRKSRFS
jgi:ornithine cyclodeaminase/alanine dehydrogenase-like protein (mu-crystallin family)